MSELDISHNDWETGFNITRGISRDPENNMGLRDREDQKIILPLRTQGSKPGAKITPAFTGKEYLESEIRHRIMTGQPLPKRLRNDMNLLQGGK